MLGRWKLRDRSVQMYVVLVKIVIWLRHVPMRVGNTVTALPRVNSLLGSIAQSNPKVNASLENGIVTAGDRNEGVVQPLVLLRIVHCRQVAAECDRFDLRSSPGID